MHVALAAGQVLEFVGLYLAAALEQVVVLGMVALQWTVLLEFVEMLEQAGVLEQVVAFEQAAMLGPIAAVEHLVEVALVVGLEPVGFAMTAEAEAAVATVVQVAITAGAGERIAVDEEFAEGPLAAVIVPAGMG